MESLINRYRNITVLVLVVLAQLVLLAVQVKNDQDVRMIRVWSVTAITPLARALEGLRSGTVGIVQNYITLRDAHEENRRIRSELDRLKVENVFLKTELASADRVKALAAFQSRTPSRTLPARVIGTGASANSKVVFLDRGSVSGVQRGMGVVTPDGIVGKVIQSYPTASEVLLVTDPDFAAGVISQKSHVHGTLKGQGYATVKVDYIPNEEKVEVGESFFTSGDDRIFPKGFPAGTVRVVRSGQSFKEILVEPTGMQHGLEEVLILLEGVSQQIPEASQVAANAPVYIGPPPPASAEAPAPTPAAGTPGAAGATATPGQAPPPITDADKLMQRYKALGDAQNHKFGEGLPGSKPPDFNMQLNPGVAPPAAAPKPKPAAPPASAAPKPKPVEKKATPPAVPAPKPEATAPAPTQP